MFRQRFPFFLGEPQQGKIQIFTFNGFQIFFCLRNNLFLDKTCGNDIGAFNFNIACTQILHIADVGNFFRRGRNIQNDSRIKWRNNITISRCSHILVAFIDNHYNFATFFLCIFCDIFKVESLFLLQLNFIGTTQQTFFGIFCH